MARRSYYSFRRTTRRKTNTREARIKQTIYDMATIKKGLNNPDSKIAEWAKQANSNKPKTMKKSLY